MNLKKLMICLIVCACVCLIQQTHGDSIEEQKVELGDILRGKNVPSEARDIRVDSIELPQSIKQLSPSKLLAPSSGGHDEFGKNYNITINWAFADEEDWETEGKAEENDEGEGDHEDDAPAGLVVGQTNKVKRDKDKQTIDAIRLGLAVSIKSVAFKPERDILMQDFASLETVSFAQAGSESTPAHELRDFKFKNYAPVAYRHLRKLLGISTEDYLSSVAYEEQPFRRLSNPGKSSSGFFLTHDGRYIIKTTQRREASFLRNILPEYHSHLERNQRTLLPKLYGQHCYVHGRRDKHLCFIIMNNLLPTSIRLHQKFDLKGSTYKRAASATERAKALPTLKDLDFMEQHEKGFSLEPAIYEALMQTIASDLRVLATFKIMDFSLLVGVHNLDQSDEGLPSRVEPVSAELLGKSNSWGPIPAVNSKGQRVLLFIGIIDILQSYRLMKKLEHAYRSLLHDGDTISVHNPTFYCKRFHEFIGSRVFRPANNTHIPL